MNMDSSDRIHELIEKYLEALASPAEIAELEALLQAEPAAADTFAQAARLHAGLSRHFQRQYKIDQVAALLDEHTRAVVPAADSSASNPAAQPDKNSAPARSTAAIVARSTFVSRVSRSDRVTRSRYAVLDRLLRWRWLVAAMVLVVAGVAVWTARSAGSRGVRVVAGRVLIGGREAEVIPRGSAFEVAGAGAAIIELPGGVRFELAQATRASISRGADTVVVQLTSGGGVFDAPDGGPSLQVETVLGGVTAIASRFSMELVTAPREPMSSTEPLQFPYLSIAVAQGSVTLRRMGQTMTLRAGEPRFFSNAI